MVLQGLIRSVLCHLRCASGDNSMLQRVCMIYVDDARVRYTTDPSNIRSSRGANVDGIKFTRYAHSICRNLRNAYISSIQSKSSILLYIITWTCCYTSKHPLRSQLHLKLLENRHRRTVYPDTNFQNPIISISS